MSLALVSFSSCFIHSMTSIEPISWKKWSNVALVSTLYNVHKKHEKTFTKWDAVCQNPQKSSASYQEMNLEVSKLPFHFVSHYSEFKISWILKLN